MSSADVDRILAMSATRLADEMWSLRRQWLVERSAWGRGLSESERHRMRSRPARRFQRDPWKWRRDPGEKMRRRIQEMLRRR